MPRIDADAHVDETEATWEYMDAGEEHLKPLDVQPPPEQTIASAAGLPPALAAMAGNPLLAVSTDAGVQTSIGGSKQGCYQWPWPVPGPVKVVLKARNGSGPIAAQAYSKKK